MARREKFIKIILILKFTTLSISVLLVHLTPLKASAATPQLQINIPYVQFTEPEACGNDSSGRTVYCNKWLGQYISGVYKYAIGVLGILAALAMMIGGIIWLTAGGDAGKVTTAKSWISGSITGLVIGFSSYFILFQINPDLIKLPAIRITKVEKAPDKVYSSLSNSSYYNCTVYTVECSSKGLVDPQDNGLCGDISIFNETETTHYCCCNKSTIVSGNCSVQDTGPCGWTNFTSAFGGNTALAKQASAICSAESGNTPCPVSPSYAAGPMQLLLSAHWNALGCSNLSNALYTCGTRTNNSGYKYTVYCINKGFEDAVNNCVQKACDPNIYPKVAQKLYSQSGWNPWDPYSGKGGGNASCKNVVDSITFVKKQLCTIGE